LDSKRLVNFYQPVQARFVMDHLRTRARERERWSIGLPLAALGFAGAGAILWKMRRPI